MLAAGCLIGFCFLSTFFLTQLTCRFATDSVQVVQNFIIKNIICRAHMTADFCYSVVPPNAFIARHRCLDLWLSSCEAFSQSLMIAVGSVGRCFFFSSSLKPGYSNLQIKVNNRSYTKCK